ncbi:hypothetical protein C7H84_35240 [Burkholderia sp. Nafp2/4-1b]|uniref:hypothetical protein n=1 Tax=Burkholderia sp. Nafp2/4-1b TaxID=2116686 RepID=UPI000EF85E9F|nr:hypothetical protein [Burkholderia sp. Nafp2/4-1b]RKT98756.1 hypothetical protein C7H84_35240 [Burkholderia sp. Nafp2/4-1b]
MHELDQLKDAMTDLRRHKDALRGQMQEFQEVQKEIAELRARASRDPDARRKLQRFDDLMKQGGDGLVERMHIQADRIEVCLKRLGDGFAQLSDAGAPLLGASRESRPQRKLVREFV